MRGCHLSGMVNLHIFIPLLLIHLGEGGGYFPFYESLSHLFSKIYRAIFELISLAMQKGFLRFIFAGSRSRFTRGVRRERHQQVRERASGF